MNLPYCSEIRAIALKDTDLSCTGSFPQMVTKAKTGSQEPGMPLRAPMWVAGTHALKRVAGSWPQEECSREGLNQHSYGMSIYRWRLNMLCGPEMPPQNGFDLPFCWWYWVIFHAPVGQIWSPVWFYSDISLLSFCLEQLILGLNGVLKFLQFPHYYSAGAYFHFQL